MLSPVNSVSTRLVQTYQIDNFAFDKQRRATCRLLLQTTNCDDTPFCRQTQLHIRCLTHARHAALPLHSQHINSLALVLTRVFLASHRFVCEQRASCRQRRRRECEFACPSVCARRHKQSHADADANRVPTNLYIRAFERSRKRLTYPPTNHPNNTCAAKTTYM